jgi:hypothetical protein
MELPERLGVKRVGSPVGLDDFVRELLYRLMMGEKAEGER